MFKIIGMTKLIWKLFRIVLTLLLAFLMYVVIGGVVPFLHHPDVSQTKKEAVESTQFYSDSAGPDRATIIEDNEEALKMRLRVIKDAKKTLILSTFDFRSDDAGKDILAALLNAADRGVKVEIFADGFNSIIQMENNDYFYALSSNKNIKIIIYNQVNILIPWNGLGRMHDKYVIADDSLYILGGRNTFGYFLGDYAGHKNYDRDVLVYNTGSKDSSIYQIKDYYKKITSQKCCSVFHYNESLGEKNSVKKAEQELKNRYESLENKYDKFLAENYDYKANTYETNKINLLSNPTSLYSKQPTVYYGLMYLAKNAKKEVKIHTPYIICNDYMYNELKNIKVPTTIMTNSAENNGNIFGAVDYLNHKKDIINTGVTIKEYEGGISYHGKSMTIDDDIAIVGSFNMDMRSAYIDTELMLVINSKDINKQLKASMEEYEKKAATVKNETEYSHIPEGMKMKELSDKKKNIKAWFGWAMNGLRFLF